MDEKICRIPSVSLYSETNHKGYENMKWVKLVAKRNPHVIGDGYELSWVWYVYITSEPYIVANEGGDEEIKAHGYAKTKEEAIEKSTHFSNLQKKMIDKEIELEKKTWIKYL